MRQPAENLGVPSSNLGPRTISSPSWAIGGLGERYKRIRIGPGRFLRQALKFLLSCTPINTSSCAGAVTLTDDLVLHRIELVELLLPGDFSSIGFINTTLKRSEY